MRGHPHSAVQNFHLLTRQAYLDLLSAGGSEAPHVLLARLGVNVNDPGFWQLGLRLLDEMVAEAESLAAAL